MPDARVEVGFVGHATVRIDVGGLRILTDPFLRARLCPLERHGVHPVDRAFRRPPQDPQYGGGAMVPMGGGQRGPIGKIRNPVMTLVLGYVTCGILALISFWSMLNELKNFRGKDDLNPIFFFIPVLQYIEIWKLNEKVLDAKRMAGVPNPQVASPIAYLFLALYFLPGDLNEIWQAASGGQLPPPS